MANNTKLYINREDGFIGMGLKKDEFVCDCSDIDDIIVFRNDGQFLVTRIADKTFVGKGILHAEVYVKGDERRVYNLIYQDGKSGTARVKRFQVLGMTRDKAYDLTLGTKGSRVLYFSSNPNGEAEIVSVTLTPSSKAKIKVFDFDFTTIDIKNRQAQGNILTKYPVKKVVLKKAGVSTLSAMKIWYDDAIGRLNKDGVGKYLGKFNEGDRILVVFNNGEYELTNYELTNRYDSNQIAFLRKFNPEEPISAIHFDGNNKEYYVKRFLLETNTLDKKYSFISDAPGSKLVWATAHPEPEAEVQLANKDKTTETIRVKLHEMIDLKGWKALGNKLSVGKKVLKVKPLTVEPVLSDQPAPETPDGDEPEKPADDQLSLFKG